MEWLIQGSESPGGDTLESKNNTIRKRLKVFFNRGALSVISFIVLSLFILVAIFAPLITRYSPYEQNVSQKYASSSADHPFGTDKLGRDILTRLAYGARISLLASLLSSMVAAVIGLVLGLIAGFFKGFISQLIMRIADAELSIPPLVLTLVLSLLFGDGVFGVVMVIGISLVPTYIRLVYGLVLSQKKNDFVLAAKLIGQSNSKIIIKHILPNCFPSLIVLFTMNLGTAMMLEASMSYLGIGIVPPTPTWGGMVSESYEVLILHPMQAILPGICIMLVVVAFNILGDGLRDALDPRLRGKL
jgi:peptide/nickel transport system permease protein